MTKSILREKAKLLAKEIIFLCRDQKASFEIRSLVDQLLRSGTSIGANIYEAQYAQSKKDFVSKLEIAQKECFETEYWLELLFETNYITSEHYQKLHNECNEIHKMLISSLKTIKEKNKKP